MERDAGGGTRTRPPDRSGPGNGRKGTAVAAAPSLSVSLVPADPAPRGAGDRPEGVDQGQTEKVVHPSVSAVGSSPQAVYGIGSDGI